MERTIKLCTIENGRFMNEIYVTYDDGTTECIGSYYPDELYYAESEFVGLTKHQAQHLMYQRDIAYLQS